jgi:AraC-like DNA-binding protein
MVTLDNAGLGRGVLTLREPPEALRWAVEHTWTEDVRRLARGTRAERMGCRGWRILPDANGHLIFSRSRAPGRRTTDDLRLVGPRTRFVDLDKSARQLTVGVRFRPGVLPLLAALPATELVDRGAPAHDLFGPAGGGLERDASGAGSPEAVLDLVLTFVAKRLEGRNLDWRVRATGGMVERSGGRVTADQLCAAMGVAPRTLRGALKDGLGVGLKRFARVRRLHTAIGLGLSGRPCSWATVASAAGYADQSHLIHEFQALVGETPSRFLARGGV